MLPTVALRPHHILTSLAIYGTPTIFDIPRLAWGEEEGEGEEEEEEEGGGVKVDGWVECRPRGGISLINLPHC